MKKLVIAEKPSVGQSIAAVLGVNGRRNGYLEGTEYIVSWCFGHLVELAGPESYDPQFVKWSREALPIIPTEWKYKVPRDKYAQFETLRRLMHRDDVAEIINACDAGREGELIFRKVYDLAECSKPVKRLWISSMEDKAIEEGFVNLRDGCEYDNLGTAARCREWADWLVGINGTRLFSTAYHRKLNAGRVVSPTLAMLVQRESEIEQFRPEPFYTVQLDFGTFQAVSPQFKSKSHAEALVEEAGRKPVVVQSVKSHEKAENPPALYDLTTLQRAANRRLGYTAQQTLDYLQSLYEKKLCTYPRTDSRYLTDSMEESVRELVLNAAALCGLDVPFAILAGQVCNSEKVSDHHAIIPTSEASTIDPGELPAGEREILLLLARQVLMAVSEPCRYLETVVEISCADHVFTAKGKHVLNLGWRLYDEFEVSQSTLPEIAPGDVPELVRADLREGFTTAPAHFTEDTILSAMESAGSGEIPADAERRGLGTPATRAGIIEKLISNGFVERRRAKKMVNLLPTPVGAALAGVLPEQLTSPLLTAEWEQRLCAVERGELEPEIFMRGITDMVRELIRDYTVVNGAQVRFPVSGNALGFCPRCGGRVVESKMGYFCESHSCRFGLWRDNRFLTGNHIILTTEMVKDLLQGKSAVIPNLFGDGRKATGSAWLRMADNGERTHYSLEYGLAE